MKWQVASQITRNFVDCIHGSRSTSYRRSADPRSSLTAIGGRRVWPCFSGVLKGRPVQKLQKEGRKTDVPPPHPLKALWNKKTEQHSSEHLQELLPRRLGRASSEPQASPLHDIHHQRVEQPPVTAKLTVGDNRSLLRRQLSK